MDLVAGVRKEGSRYVTTTTHPLLFQKEHAKAILTAVAAATSSGKTSKMISIARTTLGIRSWPVRLLSFPSPLLEILNRHIHKIILTALPTRFILATSTSHQTQYSHILLH